MHKLYYQFPNTWFGDCMPFGHGNEFFLYHQRDTRNRDHLGNRLAGIWQQPLISFIIRTAA